MSTITKLVNLKNIRLCGVEKLLPNGKSFLSFKGIPFAKPPIGELRFAPPIAIQKCNDKVDCFKEGDMCLQNDMITNQKSGSENCLFLNVYTPYTNKRNTKFPVMLFLHGGGFSTGNGNGDLYSPDYLVQEDVIVITCNYRLGPFGFLYLPKAGIYGNAGLYDQLLVLQWIQDNIKEFQGDPDNVTLFGESAGASSATIHLMTAKSRQYFHKVISQSGTICHDWVCQINPEEKARKLASLIGCQSQSDDEILEFLRNADANDILLKSKKTHTQEEKSRGLRFPFKPVIELDNKDSTFTQYPRQDLTVPDKRDIPIMIGYNSNEGLILSPKLAQTVDDYNEDPTKLLPLTLNVRSDSKLAKTIANEVKEFYFGDKPINEESIDQLIQATGDGQFVNGVLFYIEFLKQYQKKSAIYCYRFAVDDELNIFKKISGMDDKKGACHADELLYLFKSNLFGSDLNENSNAAVVRRIMCKMWSNFAKYGNPTPDNDTHLPFKWNSLNKNGITSVNDTLEIENDKIEMIPNPDRGRFEFWKKIYSKVNERHFISKL